MQRTRFTIVISATEFPYRRVFEALAPYLGKYFAGACCRPIDGVWSLDGHLFQESYEKIHTESGMQINVTVMPDEADIAQRRLKQILRDMNKTLSLNIDWVHAEITTVNAAHFQLNEKDEWQ